MCNRLFRCDCSIVLHDKQQSNLFIRCVLGPNLRKNVKILKFQKPYCYKLHTALSCVSINKYQIILLVSAGDDICWLVRSALLMTAKITKLQYRLSHIITLQVQHLWSWATWGHFKLQVDVASQIIERYMTYIVPHMKVGLQIPKTVSFVIRDSQALIRVTSARLGLTVKLCASIKPEVSL